MSWLPIAAALIGVWTASSEAAWATRKPRPFLNAYGHGFALVVWTHPSVEELDAIFERIRASGAHHLAIPYFGCQSDLYSSDVGACQVRLLGLNPVFLAQRAKIHGFETSFIPIVVTPDWKWRGFFDPIDVPAWFKSYGVWIRNIAREAQALGMQELIVGTEMTRIYRHEEPWRRLLQDLRTEFDGPLVLTVNWGDLEHGFWDEVDAIGVSAYYPLSQEVIPTQSVLDASWRRLRDEFKVISQRWDRPIHISEVGYPSASSAALTPWTPAEGALPDPALQAQCFDAFRKAWENEPVLIRANVWATAAEDASSSGYPLGFEPLGKPAEQVIRQIFSFGQLNLKN